MTTARTATTPTTTRRIDSAGQSQGLDRHASVKLENLERHGANVHPRQKTLVAISADDRRVIQEKRRISTPGFHIRRSTLAIILAVPLILGGIIVTYPYLSTGGRPSTRIRF